MPILTGPAAATVDLSDLLPYILPQLRKCPDETALFNLRLAAIEFCEKTGVWRQFQGQINTLEGVTSYEYVLDPGERVHKLLQVLLAGCDIEVVAADMGRTLDARGANGPYAYGSVESFELRPAQAAGAILLTYSVIVPSYDAQVLPQFLARNFIEQIAHGALYRLYGHHDREYGDAGECTRMSRLWADDIDTVRLAAFKGHARNHPRTRSSWF